MKPCLTTLTNIYTEMTSLVDEGRAADIVCPEFGNSDTASYEITTDKLLYMTCIENALRYIEN